jgi:autotransporter-associated beta strand protein
MATPRPFLPRFSFRLLSPALLAAFVASLCPLSSTLAQSTWDGQTDANWSTPTNWNPDGEPTLTTAVIFAAPVPLTGSTITLSAGEQALSLSFLESYILTGGDLTLGAVSSINVDPTFTATINSVLGGAATSLAKTGTGTLVLSGANTFTGALTLNAGILRATTSVSALGTGVATLTLAGGELQLANDTALNFARNATITASTQITSDRLTAGAGVTHTLGTLSMGAQTLTVAAGSNVTSGIAGVTFGNTTLTGSATINTGAGAVTTIAGTVTMGANGLTVGGAGDTVITGIAGGTGTVTKNDAGILRFTADPNQTGQMTINGGVVELNLGSGATDFNTVINSGGTLRAITASVGDAVDVTINTGGIYDFRASDTIGGISGTGVITKGSSGAATLTVNSNNETTTFAGVIQNGLGTVTLAKNGTGTLTLTGANTYTGSTTLLRGAIVLDFSAAGAPTSNILAATSTLTFNSTTTTTSTGTVRIQGVDGNTSSQTLATTAVTSGTNTLDLISGSGGTLNVNLGNITRAAGTLNILAQATGTISTTNGNGLLGNWATYTSGGTTRLARVVSNTVVGAAADFVYQTGVDIANVSGYSTTGIMRVDNTSTGQVLQGAGATPLHSIYFTDSAARTFEIASGETLQFANSGLFLADAASGPVTLGATPGAGTITAGATGAGDLMLHAVDASGLITVNSVIANNAGGGAVSVTKAGAGEVILTAANTYTGVTNVTAGILEIQNGAALGGITSGTTVLSGATLEISGGITVTGEVLTITGAGAGSAGALRSVSGNNTWGAVINFGGGATIGADGGTLTLDVATGSALNPGNNSLTFTGTGTIVVNDAITFGGTSNPGIAKNGTGTLILNAASVFTGTGAFTLNEGVVRITNGGALGGTTSATNITADASLELSGGITTDENITMTNSTGISGSGAIHNIAGNNTISGIVTTDEGTSRIMADTGTQLTISGEFRGDPTSAQNRSATIGGAGNVVLSGIVRNGTGTPTAGVLSIIKDGTGTLTMSNANAYTGTTTVSEGTLSLTGSITGSAITVAAAGTFNEGATGVLGGTTSMTSAGTTTLAGTNTHTGATNVTGGTTTLSGSVSATAVTVGAAGTFNETAAGVLAGTTSLTTAGATTLSGTNTTTGTTTVTNGTLTLNYDTGAGGTNTSKLANAAVLTLGGGTVALSGGSHVEVVGSTTLTASTKTEISRTSGTSVLALNAITLGAGSRVNINGNDIASTTNANINGMLGSGITVTIGGATEFATNSGVSDGVTSGGLIRAFTAYTDITRLGPSLLPDDITVSIRIVNGGTTGPITLASTATEINALKMDASDGPAVIDPANATDVLMIGGDNGGGVLQTATSGGLTIGGAVNDGRLTTGGTANTTPAGLLFINESTTNALTVNAIIQNNGTDVVNIVKSGAGRLVLTGTNTYTGGTRLEAGILRATTSASALGTAGTVTIAGGELQLANDTGLNFGRAVAIQGSTTFTSDRLIAGGGVTHTLGTLDLNANNTTLTFRKGANVTSLTAGITFSGAFNTNGNAVTLDVGTDVVLTMSGGNGSVADASSAITKIGAGTWIISGSNTFWEGPQVFLNQGTLDLRNTNALGDNNPTNQLITAADGTTLRLGVDTVNGDFRTDLTLSGTGGTVTLTSDRSTVGGGLTQLMDSLNLGGNTLLVQRGSNVTSGTQTLVFDAVSTVGAGATINATTADVSITAAISGAGGTLTKTGAGQLTLSGVNTYTGATTVSAGNLQIGVAGVGSLAATSALTVNGATSVLSGTGTVNGLTTVTQGVIRPGDTGGTGTGTLNLAGGLTFNPAAAGTVAELQITGPSTSDTIHITGGLTLNSNSNIVVLPSTYVAALGDSFLLMDWTGLLTLNGWSPGLNFRDGSGDTNTNLDLPDINGSGYIWDISTLTDGATGGSLRITVVAVPEPGRMLLLVGAFTAMVLRRRRK